MGMRTMIGFGLAVVITCSACEHRGLRTSPDAAQFPDAPPLLDAMPDAAPEGPLVMLDAPEAIDVDRCSRGTGRPISCACLDSSECERGMYCIARQPTDGPDPNCGSYHGGYCQFPRSGCLCQVESGVGLWMCIE